MMYCKRYWIALFLLAGSCAVNAEGIYAGAKLGIMDVDKGGFDTATNIGILAGYNFYSEAGITWAAEAELTTTLVDGDLSNSNGDWDIDTQAIYGVFKIGVEFYGKLKLGFLREDVSVGGSSEDDSGASGGIGGGWLVNENIALEAEYTQIEDDVGFWSLGANYMF